MIPLKVIHNNDENSVTRWQGYFQSLAIYNNENMPRGIKITKAGIKLGQILNKPFQRLPKDL